MRALSVFDEGDTTTVVVQRGKQEITTSLEF
jgi:hypothetical protein